MMATQGKNKRRQLTVYDDVHDIELSVDSTEEIDFINWCCEAMQLSVINDFQYQPESFVLADNIKYIDCFGKSRTLFQDHRYSPDFIIGFDPTKSLELDKEFKISYDKLSCHEVSVVIDVKGTFNRTGRSFSVDRKWVWQKFKTYVCEVIPAKFFKLFGCPKKSFYTKKTKKARTMFSGCKSIDQCFN